MHGSNYMSVHGQQQGLGPGGQYMGPIHGNMNIHGGQGVPMYPGHGDMPHQLANEGMSMHQHQGHMISLGTNLFRYRFSFLPYIDST